MSRAARLLALLETLRHHQRPVIGQALADRLGISLRTLYRDIATLQQQGATIEGEAGLGYVLRPGYTLPPLMLERAEVEALVLGIRWVQQHGDPGLAQAASAAMAKLTSVLPPALRRDLETTTLLIGPPRAPVADAVDVGVIRDAIHRERKLSFHYADAAGRASQRLVWPFAIGYFEDVRVVVAWCETRQAFRHFRTDRMTCLALSDLRYGRSGSLLLGEWKTLQA